jgi:hypothetical protein
MLGRARAAEMQSINNSLNGIGKSYNELAARINESAAIINKSSSLTLPTPTPTTSYHQSYTGLNYKYDLSNPADKLMYDVDPAAKVMDGINVDPRVNIDRSMGQYGGGIVGHNCKSDCYGMFNRGELAPTVTVQGCIQKLCN